MIIMQHRWIRSNIQLYNEQGSESNNRPNTSATETRDPGNKHFGALQFLKKNTII